MREITDIFKAISEPNRVRILLMLLQKSLCVCEIKTILNISMPTVSSHLTMLRKAGFIEDSKDGKWINYNIRKNSDNQVINDIIGSIENWYSNSEIVKQDIEYVKSVDRNQLICNHSQNEINNQIIKGN